MKTKLIKLAIAMFFFSPKIGLYAQGFIVPNGVTVVTFAGDLGMDNSDPGSVGSEVRVLQHPFNGNYSGFTLPPEGGSSFLFNPFLDEGVRTFRVDSNNPISLPPILAHDYEELLFPSSYVFEEGSPFYLGFYTGNTFAQNGIYSDPLFGWGRFVNHGDAIYLLEGALEYGGAGIFAGTETIIHAPEPSAFGLLGLGGLLFGLRYLRKAPPQNSY